MKKLLSSILLSIFMFLTICTIIAPSAAMAEDTRAPSEIECAQYLSGDNINITNAVECYSLKGAIFMRNVAFLVFIVMIIASGFIFITAGGKPEKIATANKALSGAIIGLVIVMLSFAIIAFAENALENSGAIQLEPVSYQID